MTKVCILRNVWSGNMTMDLEYDYRFGFQSVELQLAWTPVRRNNVAGGRVQYEVVQENGNKMWTKRHKIN